MSNVISFSLRKVKSDEHAEHARQQRQFITDLFPKNVSSDDLFYWIVCKLWHSSYLTSLSPEFFGYLEFTLSQDMEDSGCSYLSLGSTIRRTLTPEYPIQNHCEFLRIEVDWRQRELGVRELPTGVLEDFFEYAQCVPLNVANLSCFSYAALAAALDFPGAKMGELRRDNDKYVAEFMQNVSGTNMMRVVRIIIDLLPLQLDDNALRASATAITAKEPSDETPG